MGVQLLIIQYVLQIENLSRDTPSFQRRDRLKNERDDEIEIRCGISITKYGK